MRWGCRDDIPIVFFANDNAECVKNYAYICGNKSLTDMKYQLITFVFAAITSFFSVNAHEIITDTLRCSDRYYPGTEREIKIYVPEGYDASSPACVYVGLDGILCNAPYYMDRLIGEGKMPLTIGVFIQPGVIKDKNGNVIRYNRSNEFDMPSPVFANFLENEVFPWVERRTTFNGMPIRLSRRGADRMIFGLSSGGISAFTVAWHRPDLFSRVFSGVGTFVAMRGGNNLQAIVRKSEPRPLRVFLQDGTNDVWNALFGHWWEGNRMLATALDFAGYDARYDWSDCYHGVKRASEIFPEVLEWMWKGWPDAPKPGLTKNNLLDTLLVENSLWMSEAVKTPKRQKVAATYPDGSFTVRPHADTNRLWQYIIRNKKEAFGQPFYWLHTYDNSLLTVTAMAFDGAGDLWVVTNAGIQICDQNGRVRGIIMLPCGIEASEVVKIEIFTGSVALFCKGNKKYTRLFNTTAPVPTVTPKSQGQG